MGTFRAATILTGFFGLTVPLMPLQALFVRVSPAAARRFPHWYHRQVCKLMGVRLTIEGQVMSDRPVLLVSNHTSWLDIPVLSAVAPVSFIAKKEVSRWPFVSWLARLQRTVFVDRERRGAVGETTNEIMARLCSGRHRRALRRGNVERRQPRAAVQDIAVRGGEAFGESGRAAARCRSCRRSRIVYTRLHGVPFGRADRPLVGWYGDMEMQSHAWQLLKAGPLDVRIRIGDAHSARQLHRPEGSGAKKRGPGAGACRPASARAADGEAVTVAAPPPGAAPGPRRRGGERKRGNEFRALLPC